MSQLKLAMVGCGRIARFHLDGIEQSAVRTRVTAAVDPDAGAAAAVAERTGAATFSSFEDALQAGNFDAVDIMTPHDSHEALASQAFAAGKHVLLEKPMALDLDSCDRILATAAAAGTVFMVAENSQYWPDIVGAGRLIRDGAIGKVVTARAAFIAPLDPFWYPEDSWRFEQSRSGGGVVMDGGAHWIRPLRVWLGEIDSVVATTGRVVASMDGESQAHALLRFRSGVVATLEALTIDAPLWNGPWWRVTGTGGEVVIHGGFDGGLSLVDRAHPEGIAIPGEHGYAASFGPELRDFEAAVLDGKDPEAAAEQSLGELRTALAIYRSAASGAWESVW